MNLELVEQCPICNGKSFHSVLQCIDHTTSKETFTIQACDACNLLLTNPRPTQDKLSSYYNSDAYISHTASSQSIFDKAYHSARSYTLKWKASLIERYKIGRSLLDFGCGTGEFLKKMQDNKWEIAGVEPTELPREKANLLLNTKQAVHESLQNLPNRTYDVITLWHVLEHVRDLNKTLSTLKSLLNANGVIFVAVPNYESFDAKKYKSYWAGYDVPRHLWHFSKTNIQQLFSGHALKLEKTIPMKLDAFYVSLLSENYQLRKSPLRRVLNAVLSGVISNFKGRKRINYSSHIYVARHA